MIGNRLREDPALDGPRPKRAGTLAFFFRAEPGRKLVELGEIVVDLYPGSLGSDEDVTLGACTGIVIERPRREEEERPFGNPTREAGAADPAESPTRAR